MVYSTRLVVVAALAAVGLVACSNTSIHPSPTGISSPGPSEQVTQSPVTSATPIPGTPPVLLPESLGWTGAARGTLTDAYATCHLPGVVPDTIDIRTASVSVDFSVAGHAPGIVAQSFANDGASLYMQPGVGVHSYTLFIAASGTVTYSPDGVSGSVDAWLAPQSKVPTSPSIHIAGHWRCG